MDRPPTLRGPNPSVLKITGVQSANPGAASGGTAAGDAVASNRNRSMVNRSRWRVQAPERSSAVNGHISNRGLGRGHGHEE